MSIMYHCRDPVEALQKSEYTQISRIGSHVNHQLLLGDNTIYLSSFIVLGKRGPMALSCSVSAWRKWHR